MVVARQASIKKMASLKYTGMSYLSLTFCANYRCEQVPHLFVTSIVHKVVCDRCLEACALCVLFSLVSAQFTSHLINAPFFAPLRWPLSAMHGDAESETSPVRPLAGHSRSRTRSRQDLMDKLGRASDRIGDELYVDCAFLPSVTVCNQLIRTKFTRPITEISKLTHGLSENSFAVRPVTRPPAAAANPARFMSRKKGRSSSIHFTRAEEISTLQNRP